MTNKRINIRFIQNSKAARTEVRNGRDLIIVPSATLPDDVVMNGLKYPAEEIEKSYASLERTPAPFGHPMVNGQFVSATDPEGLNIGYIGAWNEKVKRENGRVFMDKVIDVEIANRSEDGRAVLNAIEKGEPIHTSTGLYCNIVEEDGVETAINMFFDHDAILLNEEGAATPEQGVGMMVNKALTRKGEEVEVINSYYEDATDRQWDWATEEVARAMEMELKLPLLEQIKAALKGMISGRDTTATNESDEEMAITDEQFAGLVEQVNTLSETVKNVPTMEAIGNSITEALKPLTDAQTALANAQKAKDDAELEELRGKIVKANLLDEETAGELTLNAARKLAAKAEPGKAAPIAAGFAANADDRDEFADFDMNAHLEAK